MHRMLLLAAAGLLLSGCAAPRVASVGIARPPAARFTAPKVVVFVDSGDVKNTQGPDSAELLLGEALRNQGFQVKRFADRGDASIPFALEVRGALEREVCVGPGLSFAWLNVFVIDLKRNETVMTIRGEGPAENCRVWAQPNGDLFAKVARTLADAWVTVPAGVQAEPRAGTTL